MVEINDWSFTLHTEKRVGIRGVVKGHPTMEDGKLVFTSPMLKFDSAKMVANTRNTEYKLMDMSEDFKNWLVKEGHKLSDYDDVNEIATSV